MSHLIPAERQRSILATLAGKEVASIAELTELLGVSHMTVRRDIQHLEQEGRVIQVSGGARLPERLVSEFSHKRKMSMQAREKQAIAQMAAEIVPPHATIYLDAGTTCLALARALAPRNDIVVVTNDFAVCAYLMENSSCILYHTGGRVLRENESCVGESAAQFFRSVNIDIAFLSASSWDSRYISTPSEAKVPVKRAVVSAAARRILVCDSAKYGKVGFFNALPLSDVDTIITDRGLDPNVRAALTQAGTDVLIAAMGRKTAQ
jgi:Transcriptional regulators of sugar metabolism